ncbi:hypothetical protein Nmel_017567, partial [Mimus melanotis]
AAEVGVCGSLQFYLLLISSLRLPQPCGSHKVPFPLINNLQPLWSPSKISWTSVRPKSPRPTQEKTSTKYKYPAFHY